MKTPAAILVEQKKPLVIDEVELPALSYGQVLVQIHVTRICGSQLGEIEGVKGPDRWLPHLLGHEAGGIVLEVGPEVKHVKPGNRVVCHWRPGVGISANPPKYRWRGATCNAGQITTFQQYAILSENRLTPVPDDFSFDHAALLADTITTGFGVIVRDAQVQVGESVVIIGSGGIGLGAILAAHLAGAHPVIAVDIHDHKLEVARAHGASHTVNTRSTPLADALAKILNGSKPDVMIDGTGNPSIIEQAYQLTADKGRCVLFGVMPHDKSATFNTLPLHFGKVLTGSEGGQSIPQVDIPRYVRMIRDGRMDLSRFISHRYSLAAVNTAIEQMKAGEVIHAVIDF